jgi:hypothetical protein
MGLCFEARALLNAGNGACRQAKDPAAEEARVRSPQPAQVHPIGNQVFSGAADNRWVGPDLVPGSGPRRKTGLLRWGDPRPEKVIGWSDCRITDEKAAA